MRIVALVGSEHGFLVHTAPEDGGGSTPHRVIAWALTEAGAIEPCWWSGERVEVGTGEWPITEPGDRRFELAGSAAEAIAARFRNEDDDGQELEVTAAELAARERERARGRGIEAMS